MHARIDELEVRYTYLERTVEELDEVVLELRAEVDKLRQELRQLGRTESAEALPMPHDEKPPHY